MLVYHLEDEHSHKQAIAQNPSSSATLTSVSRTPYGSIERLASSWTGTQVRLSPVGRKRLNRRWSPYQRWQDLYPAAVIDQKLDAAFQQLEEQRPDQILLTHHHRGWNDDPQPLVRVRAWSERHGKADIGVRADRVDPWSVIDLIRSGWIDFVEVPFGLMDQRAAAGLLDAADAHAVAVVAYDVWHCPVDKAQVADLLKEREIEDDFLTTAFRFVASHPMIKGVVVDDVGSHGDTGTLARLARQTRFDDDTLIGLRDLSQAAIGLQCDRAA